MAACRVESFPLCHAAGGAGYGLSRAALRALHGYARRGFPPYGDEEAFLTRVDRMSDGGLNRSAFLGKALLPCRSRARWPALVVQASRTAART